MTSMKRKLTLATLTAIATLSLTACQTTASKGPQWEAISLPPEIASAVQMNYDKNSIVPSAENKQLRKLNVMYQATDPATPVDQGAQSAMTQLTFNCETPGVRIDKMELFDGRDAMGEVVNAKELPAGDQFLPVKDAIDQQLFEIACKK